MKIVMARYELKSLARQLCFFGMALSFASGQSLSDFVSSTTTCASDYSCDAALAANITALCRCDNNCNDYGDCCYDAPAYNKNEQIYNLKRIQCIHGRKMFYKCARDWDDSEVANLCSLHSPSNISSSSEPLFHVPIKSKVTGFTYVNLFCAICNNDATDTVPWEATMTCSFENDNKTVKEYLDILIDYFDLEPSLFRNYRLQESNTANITEEVLKEERVIEFFKSNLSYSISKRIWVVVIPTAEPITMMCSFDLDIPKSHNIFSDIIGLSDTCDPNLIDACASNWTNKEIQKLCYSFSASIDYVENYTIIDNSSQITAVTESKLTTYRNIFCAECNYIHIENPCIEYIGVYLDDRHFFPPIAPFTILLQTPDTIQRKNLDNEGLCKDDESYFPIYNSCNNILCSITPEKNMKGICLSKNKKNEHIDRNDDNEDTTNKTMPIFCHNDRNNINGTLESLQASTNATTPNGVNNCSFSVTPKSFINITDSISNATCYKTLILRKDYYRTIDGIAIKNTHRIYSPEAYEETDNGILVCSFDPEYYGVLAWVSFVGLLISCICIVLHLTAFILIKELRNLPGKNLATLCICLLTGYITFICGSQLVPKTMACYSVAALMYFCFIASFIWMNAIAFDTWKSFDKATISCVRRTGDQWKTYGKYSIICWSLSITAIVVMIVIDKLEPTVIPSSLYPKLGQYWCWFGQNKSLYLFFVGPMVVSGLISISLYFKTSWILYRANNETTGRFDQLSNRTLLYGHIRLAILMGVTWVTAISAWYSQSLIWWFIFVILNTLQGAFIFIAFTCKRTVWQKIKIFCNIHNNGKNFDTKLRRTLSGRKQQKRMELLHVSKHIDTVHEPSRIHGVFTISTST